MNPLYHQMIRQSMSQPEEILFLRWKGRVTFLSGRTQDIPYVVYGFVSNGRETLEEIADDICRWGDRGWLKNYFLNHGRGMRRIQSVKWMRYDEDNPTTFRISA